MNVQLSKLSSLIFVLINSSLQAALEKKIFLNYVKYLDGRTQKKPEQTSTKHPPKKSKDIVRKRSVLPPLNRKHP